MLPDVSQETLARIKELNGGKENTLIVRFYPGDAVDEKRTNGWIESRYDDQTGKEIVIRHQREGGTYYRPHPWIEIRAPGDKDEIRQRPVREEDKVRFPREWELFQKGTEEPASGTPLLTVAFLTKGQVLEFAAGGINTVEHLAEVSDVNGQKFMDFHRVRQRARDYLAAQAKNAPAALLREELEQRDARIAALEEQIKALAEKKK